MQRAHLNLSNTLGADKTVSRHGTQSTVKVCEIAKDKDDDLWEKAPYHMDSQITVPASSCWQNRPVENSNNKRSLREIERSLQTTQN